MINLMWPARSAGRTIILREFASYMRLKLLLFEATQREQHEEDAL
jgi:hypothetical protein